MHHKLFDRGVFTRSDNLNVMVSESANGTKKFQEWVMAFHGKIHRFAPAAKLLSEDGACAEARGVGRAAADFAQKAVYKVN